MEKKQQKISKFFDIFEYRFDMPFLRANIYFFSFTLMYNIISVIISIYINVSKKYIIFMQVYSWNLTLKRWTATTLSFQPIASLNCST